MPMAKMFLTLDETMTATGKSEAELTQLIKDGQLREFRDGARLMFKEDQVRGYVGRTNQSPQNSASVCFIGHGRSPAWRELADFLERRLKVKFEEFNRESVAGRATTERIEELLLRCNFAFLVLTAEDEHADGTHHARENVIHEVGLFQGRLGFRKAIIMLEQGCATFSNIHGLTYIGFSKNRLRMAFEDVREVLERESIIP
jgi:predicted nucleotide-binding protein